MLAAIAVTTLNACVPSITASSTPVTVTTCALFQLPGPKVSIAGETTPSAVSLLLRPIVTVAAGCDPRATVNVTLPPTSLTTAARPGGGVTMTLALSLSLVVTATSAGSRPA